MKLISRYFSIVVVLNFFFTIVPEKVAAQGAQVSFQVFYDDLNPYGQWVDYPSYGYVWIPMAGSDFFPYSSNGHWVMTNYGWTWVSNYNWGWAPFHYGRWSYDDYYGWFWMPGNTWGPAWVAWRSSDASYGWTPMGPNISIDIAIGNGYNVPPNQWTFLPNQYMGRDDINNYYGPRKNSQEFINNSTVINNTYIDNSTHTTYIAGPRKEEVQKATGAPIKPVDIKENSKPGQSFEKNQLKIYRPVISESANKGAKPSKIADKKDVKPISERNVVNQKSKEVPSKNPANKEPLQKTPVNPKSGQKENQQKQNVPAGNKEKQAPVEQKKQHDVPLQPEKVNPKVSQKDFQQKQNVPDNNNDRQAPVPQNKQPNTPPQQPVPIQKDRQEKQQEQRSIEPKSNVQPPSKPMHRKEKVKATSEIPE